MTTATWEFVYDVDTKTWKKKGEIENLPSVVDPVIIAPQAKAENARTMIDMIAPWMVPAGIAVMNKINSAMAIPVTAAEFSTPITSGLWPIVSLMQDAALPVGVCLALYGIFEWVLDQKEGKQRVQRSVMAYIAVFIIPIGFRAIQKALGGMMIG